MQISLFYAFFKIIIVVSSESPPHTLFGRHALGPPPPRTEILDPPLSPATEVAAYTTRYIYKQLGTFVNWWFLNVILFAGKSGSFFWTIWKVIHHTSWFIEQFKMNKNICSLFVGLSVCGGCVHSHGSALGVCVGRCVHSHGSALDMWT